MANPTAEQCLYLGMPEVEWLAMLARDDKYATVQYCDVPIQDRRALIAEVKRLQERITELHALGQAAANRADDAERSCVETPAPQRYGWCVSGMYKCGSPGEFGPDEGEYVLAVKTSVPTKENDDG